MIDRKKLDLALQWAADVNADRETLSQDTIDAAAEVITALPDVIVDGDKLRDAISNWEFSDISAGEFVDMVRDLLPDPALPTLADTEWDDNVHPYMEAVTASGRRYILVSPWGNTSVSGNTVLVVEHGGGVPVLVSAECLFPTGRYARLSLPDEPPTPG